MKPCESFECREYKLTCSLCETVACACNPTCEKCKYYEKTCSGSGQYWLSREKREIV